MSHTPGPWTIDDSEGPLHLYAANGECLMGNDRYYPWCPDSRDDWNLIAAAPDLLAALQALVNQIDPKDTPIGLGSILNARAAIAKALGHD